MRVLYLADRLSMRGGADQHLRQVMTWATAEGFAATLACGRIDHGAQPPAGVRVVRVRGLAAMTRSSSRLAGLDALLAATDIVHVHNLMNPEACERAAAARPTLTTIQDHRHFCPGPGKTLPDGSLCGEVLSVEICAQCLPDPTYLTRTLELTRQRLDAAARGRVVVLSSYMAGELAAAGVAGAEVIPPWVESGSDARTDGGRGFVIGGRLVPHKGVLEAYRAWSLAGTDQPLTVAGSGPLEAELQRAERRGWLDQQALRHLLGTARALLFPGRWQEPFGLLAIQALAAGTPVISSATGGASAWHDRGVIRCAPGDVSAMAAAVTDLADNPERARELGESGRRMVAERFARPAIEARLRELYRRAAVSATSP